MAARGPTVTCRCTVTGARLDATIGHRHGLLPPPAEVAPSPADLDAMHNWSVSYSPEDPWRAAGGGVAWTREDARNAAIAEALERYAAVSYELPLVTPSGSEPTRRLSDFTLFSTDQQRDQSFPHLDSLHDDAPLTDVYRLATNERTLVPAALVGLTDRFGALPTSSGLAAAATNSHALLRATQELIERDAFMSVWLHALAPPHAPLLNEWLAPVRDRGGWALAFDITPAYSPHAVAMVVGNLPLDGRPRFSLGLACRGTWFDAAEKAYLEWSQGVIFAGHRSRREPNLSFPSARDVRTFDDHATYYTVHPDRWLELPFMVGESPPAAARPSRNAASLAELVTALEGTGVELFYRDLTLPDLRQIGLSVVRVLSPALTPIHADHHWPHLGGTTADVDRRFAWASESWARPLGERFPSPFPHPLG